MTNHSIEEAKRIVREGALRARSEGRAPRVLYVCLGNICRSPAAQGITEKMASERAIAVECDSAGFYGGHAGDLPDPRMRSAAFARGYRLDHRSRTIRSIDLEEFDIVVGMDDRNINSLRSLAATPEQENKIIRMAALAASHPEYDYVPDPYYEGAAGFELVLNLLEDACSVLLDTLSEA